MRQHAGALVDALSSKPIFIARDQLDKTEFLCGAKLWCLEILEAALTDEPDNTNFDRLNAQCPLSCVAAFFRAHKPI